MFIAQRIARVITIYEDESTKEMLNRTMVCSKTQELFRQDDSWAQLLRRKYGWIQS